MPIRPRPMTRWMVYGPMESPALGSMAISGIGREHRHTGRFRRRLLDSSRLASIRSSGDTLPWDGYGYGKDRRLPSPQDDRTGPLRRGLQREPRGERASRRAQGPGRPVHAGHGLPRALQAGVRTAGQALAPARDPDP